MGNGRVNYFDWRWAWVGQVDLFLTNIGPKMLHLGFKITAKVLGNEYLEETAVLARLSMLSKGNEADLLRSGLPTTLRRIVWPHCSSGNPLIVTIS